MSLGGNKSSGSSSQQSTQGFRDLPEDIQWAFKHLAQNATHLMPGGKWDQTNNFTPLGVQAGEQKAIDAINQGFAPNATQLNSDIAMQMNPFDDYVIDGINREAQGQNSVLQQNLNSAGQFGSNRAFLGANDIDLTRLNQIGQFKQGQFNTSLNNALNILPEARARDAQGQLEVGGFLRGLDQQSKLKSINNLSAISSLLGVLPTNSGQSTGSSRQSGWGFSLGLP